MGTVPLEQQQAKIESFLTAALSWHELEYTVTPIVPEAKQPAVKWDPWITDLSAEKITDHWSKHPDHEIGFIVGDDIIVFDADSQEAIDALRAIEESHGICSNMIVKTKKGEHHYFRRAKGTYAKSDAHCTETYPHRIDIKTGRAIVILPPSTGKSLSDCSAKKIDDLIEVEQWFIDSFYLHNDRDAPRPPEPADLSEDRLEPSSDNTARVKALLGHISPNCGYEDWLHALMAVHHETGGSDEGLALADQWSRGGSKYKGIREIKLKWDSFRSNTGSPFTIGTLIHMVKETGADWQDVVVEPFEVIENTTVEPVAEIPKKSKEEGTFLDKFSLKGMSEQLKKDAVDQVLVLGEIALTGELTAIYAEPGTGKTLITLKLLTEAIEQGRINPSTVYYLNMDDGNQGLLEKVRTAEDFDFHIIAGGYKTFKAEAFLDYIRELIDRNEAKNAILILDTLKKFVDLMSKKSCREFSNIAREFASKGGTLIALAHPNKNRAQDGKLIPGGTSDIKDDFDCVYMLDKIGEDPKIKTVEFVRTKRRGNVIDKVAYSYCNDRESSYIDRLFSVRLVDEEKIDAIKHAELLQKDTDLIKIIIEIIRQGINSKMELAKAAAERASISQRDALKVIDRYTGKDLSLHRWNFTMLAHRKQLYTPLEPLNESIVSLDE